MQPCPLNAILQEAQQLHSISDRLDSLAETHPIVSAALITISGSVRNTATLLEVLVATKKRSSLGIPRKPDLLAPAFVLRQSSVTLGLVVKNNIQQRTVYLQTALAIVEET